MERRDFGSFQLDEVAGVDGQTSEDEREEREREIQKMLSKEFDNISSLSDDDETDKENHTSTSHFQPTRLENGSQQTSPFAWQQPHLNDEKTSTPNYEPRKDLPRLLRSALSSITEENESRLSEFSKAYSRDFEISNRSQWSPVKSPVEAGRRCALNSQITLDEATIFDKLSELGDDDISLSCPKEPSVNVQKLLEENQILHNKLSTSYGDREGLAYKLSRAETQNRKLEDEIKRLLGKISALEMQKEVEQEAKEDFMGRLAIAESTIESLQQQLVEIGKSDCLYRARSNHEAIINELTSKYETQVNQLIDANSQLKSQLDDEKKTSEALRLSLEKMSSDYDNMRSERDVNAYQIQRLEEEIQSANSKVRESIIHVDESETLYRSLQKNLEREQQAEFDQQKSFYENLLRNKEREQQAELDQQKSYYENLLRIKEQEINHSWEEKLSEQVDHLLAILQGKSEKSEAITFLSPLQDFWRNIEGAFEQRKEEELQRLNEIREAEEKLKTLLEKSQASLLPTQQQAPHDQTRDFVVDEMRAELDLIANHSKEMKTKLINYKRNYQKLIKNHESEMKALKAQHEEEMKRLKSSLKPQISDRSPLKVNDGDLRFKVLSDLHRDYVDSVRLLKDRLNIFLQESNKKSIEKIARSLLSYHELVTSKVLKRLNAMTDFDSTIYADVPDNRSLAEELMREIFQVDES